MYKLTNDKRYRVASKKVTSFYIREATPLIHTHPLGYWLEGLYAGGEEDFVYKFLVSNVIDRIQDNGFISYTPELDYSYTSGQAQLAILMYNLGIKEEALIVRNFIRNVQANHTSGGIFQFVNQDASLNRTVHSEINSWGTKYFCELERLTEKNG